jgi:hypothetical protein
VNTPVLFDAVDIIAATPGARLLSSNPYAPAKRKISIAELADLDKNRVTSGYYRSRRISLRIGIGASTRGQVEQSIDTLMGLIQGIEKDLVLSQGAAVRRYTATLSDASIIHGGGSYIEIDLLFDCSDAFGYDTAYTVIANVAGATAASRQDNYTFAGSAPWQAPIFQVQVDAVTGGSNASILIGNLNTGQTITITRTWVAGDLLIVNSQTGSVTVNGSEVSFSGAFPLFVRGAGTLTYSDTFTTRTIDLYAYYYKRYV